MSSREELGFEEAQRDLREIGTAIKTFAERSRSDNAETIRRVHALEQIVVTLDGFDGIRRGNSYPSAGLAGIATQEITQAQAFAHLKSGNQGTARVQMAASIRAALVNEGYGSSSDGGIASSPERGPFSVAAMRPLRLLDFLVSRPVTADTVEHVRLVATGDAGEQVTEGALKPQVDLDGVLVKSQIATIAAFSSASKQVLADHAALQGSVDLLIRQKLLDRLENQLINGLGGLGEIEGLLTLATAFSPTYASDADAVGQALATQSAAGYATNLVVLNPMDWFAITASKGTDGQYLFGAPTAQLKPALWSAPVVTSASIASGTALIFDLSRVSLLDREQPSIMVSNSHEDYFRRNLVAILGELRAGLEVTDTGAIRKINLLAS